MKNRKRGSRLALMQNSIWKRVKRSSMSSLAFPSLTWVPSRLKNDFFFVRNTVLKRYLTSSCQLDVCGSFLRQKAKGPAKLGSHLCKVSQTWASESAMAVAQRGRGDLEGIRGHFSNIPNSQRSLGPICWNIEPDRFRLCVFSKHE